MANPNGNPSSLVPAPLGNRRAEKHGLYSRREVAPEVRELADELIEALPHTTESDYPAALEIAKLVVLTDRIDAAGRAAAF